MDSAPRPPLRHRLRPVHWLALDLAAAAVYGVLAYGVLAARIDRQVLAAAGVAVVCAALVVARRLPLVAAGAALAVFWLAPLSPRFGWLAAAPLAYALYRVAERYPARPAAVALAAGLTGPVATVLPSRHTGAVLPFGLLLAAAWAVGAAVHQHRRYNDELLRHQRDRAERQVADERVRIARELHDVVAHSMSLITVQAAFGRLVVDEQPARAGEALAIIETTGRESLAELRRILGVLRNAGPVATTPAPGLTDLARLAEQTRAAGVHVDLTVAAEPDRLPPGVQLSVYRIVQEALTNVVKHAKTDAARVSVEHRPDAVVLEVTDHGRGGLPEGPGHGIAGMRERVALYGGTLQAGPLPGRGFRVGAHLPLTAGQPS
ncbi:sensor histidine kinase [Actinoplanes sp. CA-030573]|uniref:sensor histidine kinase n=1 Tax=Actinoplanes sp. CA-030573 TaxID=3239898 RepID=UPI003D8BA056